jgi:anti-sigma regulatory factor (Ser/Thr protein kinase)
MTEIRRELWASPDAGRAARGALDGWLTHLVGAQTADEIRLAASELVDNAVLHGRLSADDLIVLSGVATKDVVRIQVEQPTSAGAARVIDPGERDDLEGGFGLRIVQELASSWGVANDPRGAVWFEVDRDIR